MNKWNYSPPSPSELGDHEVPLEGTELAGKSIALLITGGIASIKAPFIARLLRKHGAGVMVYASPESLRYTTGEALEWSSDNFVITELTSAAEHLFRFDLYLIAPATYNTINKVARGIADTVVTTTIASALGRMEREGAKILLAPTMHGSMHNSLLTESLKKLDKLGITIIPPRDQYGKHNIPDDEVILGAVIAALGK